MLAGIGWWCGFYTLEAVVPALGAKMVFAQLEYLGIVTVPVFWFLFSLRYTGRDEWLKRKLVALLSLVPILTLILVATNGLHHLVWSSVRSDPTGPFPALLIGHGPYFWLHLAYSYLLILGATGTLVWSVVRYPKNYQHQAVLITAGAIVPWAANLLYALGLVPDDNLDPTPFAFALTGALLALALSRYRLLHLFLGLRGRARSALIEDMPDGLIVLDGENRIIDCNPAASAILGGSSRPLLGTPLEEVSDLPCVAEKLALSGDFRCEVELEAQGESRIFDVLSSRLGQRDIEASGHLVVLRDISEKRRAEEAARESEQRYRTLVENANELIFTLDSEGRLTSVNPAVEHVTGFAKDELVGQDVDRLLAENKRPETSRILLALDTGETQEVRVKSKAGSTVVLEASIRATYHDGETTGYECIARDVTESRAWEEALRFQALHDSVTSLPNRMHLRERLHELITSAQTQEDRLALLVLDLDDFKRVNDNLGHHIGDALLEVVGLRLGRSIRAADILARLGGDEFALLVHVDDAADARRVARRVLGAFQRVFAVEGHQLALSASVGVAIYPEHGSTVDTLLRVADIAMYAAKRGGGSRYAIYEVKIDHHSPDVLTLQGDLHKALSQGELTLLYQPQIDLRTNRVAGVEALVRWNHPRRGLILPSQFIDLLEHDGLADRLTRWVLDKALAQGTRWQARGLSTQVSVNLSARNLDNPDLTQVIEALLDRHQTNPARLTVELTETSVMMEPERAIASLGAIRALGVKVSIDDFGSGQTALPYLKTLPADEVKVDKSFVIPMTVDKGDAAIVRSIIGLGHELGLLVVAEGIENEATRRLLVSYGCDIGQGYFLGRPVRPISVATRLRSQQVALRTSRGLRKDESIPSLSGKAR